MKRLDSLGAQIAAAEHQVLERRILVRLRAKALAAHARRRLASPVAILAAAGAGFLLASRRGRSGLGKIFGALQLMLAALSAFAAAK